MSFGETRAINREDSCCSARLEAMTVEDNNGVMVTYFRSCACSGEIMDAKKPANQKSFIDLSPPEAVVPVSSKSV
jgi:hypothetical protein